MDVWCRALVCVKSRRRVMGIHKILELCPCMWCLKGSWSPIICCLTVGVVDHGTVVVLGRVDGVRRWVSYVRCQLVTGMEVGGAHYDCIKDFDAVLKCHFGDHADREVMDGVD